MGIRVFFMMNCMYSVRRARNGDLGICKMIHEFIILLFACKLCCVARTCGLKD